MSICITLHLIFIHYILLVVEFCILFIYDVIKGRWLLKMSRLRARLFRKAKKDENKEEKKGKVNGEE